MDTSFVQWVGSGNTDPFTRLKYYIDTQDNSVRGSITIARSSAVAPTATDIPNGRYAVWYNSTAGTAGVFYNNGGTIVQAGGASGGSVASFNGRTGAVVPASNDYAFTQLSSIPNTVAGYGISDAVSLTGTQTLTNKTLTSPVIGTIINTGTLTLPTSTDTLVGAATTNTLTNKTFDTAGTGNVLKINSTQVSAVTGTGSVVLATSPTITTPSIGGPFGLLGTTSGTTLITTGTTGGGTVTIPAVTDQVVCRNTGDSLNNKTLNGFSMFVTVNSGTTLTLSTTSTAVYIFSGTSAATWTLPALTGNTNKIYFIKSRGTALLTLVPAGADNLYTTSSVTSLVINPGESYIVVNDSSFWLIL